MNIITRVDTDIGDYFPRSAAKASTTSWTVRTLLKTSGCILLPVSSFSLTTRSTASMLSISRSEYRFASSVIFDLSNSNISCNISTNIGYMSSLVIALDKVTVCPPSFRPMTGDHDGERTHRRKVATNFFRIARQGYPITLMESHAQ